tara:strand:+ start:3085 stop:3669 length:585 start_codon:yes stop_codon:yes gene_type:complete
MDYHILKIRKALGNCVFDKSENKTNIKEALKEWVIIAHYESENEQACLCGKENVVDVYCLQNNINRKFLDPIGSECIKRFQNPEMVQQMKEIKEKEKLERKELKQKLKREQKEKQEKAESDKWKEDFERSIEKKKQEQKEQEHNKIFNNPNKKCDGKTYQWLCENETKYVLFLKQNAFQNNYKDLVKYYDKYYL